jgi:hypothetical protein
MPYYEIAEKIAQIFTSVTMHIIIVVFSILMFIFVKMGSGKKGRYLTYLSISWAIMGLMYLLSGIGKYLIIVKSYRWQFHITLGKIFEVLDTTLSITNSCFLIIAWYLMRDYRREKEAGIENPLPTMSKPFISSIFALGTSMIALLIIVSLKVEDKNAMLPLNVLDVVIAAVAIILIGIELLRIHVIIEPEEGDIFRKDLIRHIFKVFTFVLYLAWAILQLCHLIPKITKIEYPHFFFDYPSGVLYTLMAILKIMCATTAVILIIHSLPSYRWPHKQIRILDKKKDERKRPKRA